MKRILFFPIAVAGALAVSLFSAPRTAWAVPLEAELARGIEAFNRDRCVEAEPHFLSVLSAEPKHFLAMEYLGACAELAGSLEIAKDWFIRARDVGPPGRVGLAEFHSGRLSVLTGDDTQAERALERALTGEDFPVDTPYLMGYLRYRQGRYSAALPFLMRARDLAQSFKSSPREQSLLQPIHYYLGEVYARLGYDRYAVAEFWAAERGNSADIRRGAWNAHAWINEARWKFNAVAGLGYVPSVTLRSFLDGSPIVVTDEVAMQGRLGAAGGFQTSPANPWIFAVDASLDQRQYFSPETRQYSTMDFKISPKLDFWTRRYWLLRLTYDYEQVFTDSANYGRLQTIQGPELKLQYFPFQRWVWEVGVQFLSHTYWRDPSGALADLESRSGQVLAGFIKLQLASAGSLVRPALRYRYETQAVRGLNYRANLHYAGLSADVQLWKRTIFFTENYLILRSYPDQIANRRDVDRSMGFGLRQFFDEGWSAFARMDIHRNGSTINTLSYGQVLSTAGVEYTF